MVSPHGLCPFGALPPLSAQFPGALRFRMCPLKEKREKLIEPTGLTRFGIDPIIIEILNIMLETWEKASKWSCSNDIFSEQQCRSNLSSTRYKIKFELGSLVPCLLAWLQCQQCDHSNGTHASCRHCIACAFRHHGVPHVTHLKLGCTACLGLFLGGRQDHTVEHLLTTQEPLLVLWLGGYK